MKDEQKQEMVRLIKEAGECLKCGRSIRDCENDRLKKMMKKIVANAVAIGLYDFNKVVISDISEGDFTTIKENWEEVRNDLIRCLLIIDNEGEDLDDILGVEGIEEAVRFTIFELEVDEYEG